MSFLDCLDIAVEEGKLRPEARDLMADLFRDFHKGNISSGMAEGDAAAKAKQQTARHIEMESLHKRRRSLMMMQRKQALMGHLAHYTNAKGVHDIAAALPALLERDPAGQARFSSVDGRHKAILGDAHAKMEELLFDQRPALSNREAPARMSNIVRELFGEDTGDIAAKELAKSACDVLEGLRQRFNAAGGAIGKLEKWGMPQNHDYRALKKAGFETWAKHITPLLDRQRMKFPLTGEVLTEAQLRQSLEHIYNSIISHGWNTREPKSLAQGRGALANQHAHHRFLVFKDADSWLKYQADFGKPNHFNTLMGHINVLSRDIAAMEILGPNPDGMLEYLSQLVKKEGEAAAMGEPNVALPPGKDVSGDIKLAKDMWLHMRGSANIPVNKVWARWFAGARNVVTATTLGAASLSSVTDFNTAALRRRFAGLPVAPIMKDYLKAYYRSGEKITKGDMRDAAAAGLIVESALNTDQKMARYAGTISGDQFAARLADFTIRRTGLEGTTTAQRNAHGMALMYDFGKNVADGKRWKQLHKDRRELMKSWGFTPEDWELMRSVELFHREGVPLLRPQEMVDAGRALDPEGGFRATRIERLGEKYIEMIHSEMELAVPSHSFRARARALVRAQPAYRTWRRYHSDFGFRLKPAQ